MRETLQLLRGLQELDRDLYRVKDELRRLPEERGRRREGIDNERSRLTEMERKLFEVNQRIKEIEDLTTSQRQRLRKLEGEVATTTDAAMIAAFQHEMRTLRRDIGEAEEEGLGLVEQAETLKAGCDTLAERIDELERDFEEYSSNVESELSSAEAKRLEMDQERRKRMGATLRPDVLSQYEKLLDAREGQAMAMLDGRICQGCHVSVPSNIYVRLARGMEIVLCPSCNRILYLPDRD